jgi:hypothetical protein
MGLKEAMNDGDKRARVIDDCVGLVDDEVGKKGGLGGVVIKAGYKAVRGIKPGFIREVVAALFDRWVEALDPIWAEGAARGAPADWLEKERGRVADALLGVTDARSRSAKSALVRGTYDKLRPAAKRHVEEAVPGLARILARHVGS